ncbi:restriction endonuclease subunit S [Bacillus sp. FJAT-22058]|nr:restriction endonuclease subunit S [Bacillus sp. FJAT-22058]
MKNNHTPEIRFSGFTGNWVEYKFGDIYDVVSGYAFKMSDYVQGGVPIINGESIQHGSISTKNLNFLPEGFSDKYQNFILDTGDIVLGLNRPITNGKLKIAQVPKDLHGALLYQRAGKIIILNNSNINFSYQLLGNEVSKFVLKEAVGSDQPFISTTKLKKWLICIPALEEEQTEIGNFLKQLDDTIALHQQELTTLKQTKQGFLQKMFPKEGESVPEIRFAGFSGDWKECKLTDVKDREDKYSFTGGPFGSDLKSSDYTVEGIRIIQLQNIGDGEFLNSYKIYTSEKKAIELSSNLIYPGEIIIAKMAEPLARATIMPDFDEKYLMASDGIRLKIDKNDYDTYFILTLINSPFFRKEALSNSTGTTRKRIGLVTLGNLPIVLPNLNEQTKIGNFFKQLDETIVLHQRELDSLKDTKKAFLQKMFV